MATALNTLASVRTRHGALEDLSIRFLQRGPDEDLVEYLRSCASKLTRDGKLEVTIAPHRYGVQVQLEGSASAYPVVETDPDPFVAARRAFARWAAVLDAEAHRAEVMSTEGGVHASPRA
jgi:hypothetical protein